MKSTSYAGGLFRSASALALAFALAAAGCADHGPKKVTLNGTVTVKGQPLPGGMIQFFGPDGAVNGAIVLKDGTFTATDLTPGQTTVAFVDRPQNSNADGKKGAPAGAAPVSLAAKYYDPQSSDLKYTIDRNQKTLEIVIP